MLVVASLSGARRSESQQCSLSRVTGMPAVASSVEENRVSDELKCSDSILEAQTPKYHVTGCLTTSSGLKTVQYDRSEPLHQEKCIYIIEEKTGELYCIILN